MALLVVLGPGLVTAGTKYLLHVDFMPDFIAFTHLL